MDEATDGREAVQKALSLQADLIVMDLSLPGTSGVDATAQIRRRLPQQKVLALSEYGSEMTNLLLDGVLHPARLSARRTAGKRCQAASARSSS